MPNACADGADAEAPGLRAPMLDCATGVAVHDLPELVGKGEVQSGAAMLRINHAVVVDPPSGFDYRALARVSPGSGGCVMIGRAPVEQHEGRWRSHI